MVLFLTRWLLVPGGLSWNVMYLARGETSRMILWQYGRAKKGEN